MVGVADPLTTTVLPEITSIEKGQSWLDIVIKGKSFGSIKGEIIINKTPEGGVEISRWIDNEISFKLPDNYQAATPAIAVKAGGQLSGEKSYTLSKS
jgi:hypothetical protein